MAKSGLTAVIFLLGLIVRQALADGPISLPASARLPDLREVVPYHLQLYNGQKKTHSDSNNGGGNVGNDIELLRFSSGIANTGAGPLELDPTFVGTQTIVDANQNIYDSLTDAGSVVFVNSLTDAFEFHAAHNHWHLQGVALFEVRAANDNGTGGAWSDSVASSLKETFCLIDYVPMSELSLLDVPRRYFDCFSTQGIGVGWVDAYHHSTEGQSVDVTGLPNGIYYFVATANPDGIFIESDRSNNSAWTSFELRDTNGGKGERSIVEIANSGCAQDEPSLCGYSTNR